MILTCQITAIYEVLANPMSQIKALISSLKKQLRAQST